MLDDSGRSKTWTHPRTQWKSEDFIYSIEDVSYTVEVKSKPLITPGNTASTCNPEASEKLEWSSSHVINKNYKIPWRMQNLNAWLVKWVPLQSQKYIIVQIVLYNNRWISTLRRPCKAEDDDLKIVNNIQILGRLIQTTVHIRYSRRKCLCPHGERTEVDLEELPDEEMFFLKLRKGVWAFISSAIVAM